MKAQIGYFLFIIVYNFIKTLKVTNKIYFYLKKINNQNYTLYLDKP